MIGAAELDQIGGPLRDAQDLREGLLRLGRGVDADDAVGAAVGGEADHHAGLRRAGHRADEDVVETEAELLLLRPHLLGEADIAEPAEP